jgi:hypothetical protein
MTNLFDFPRLSTVVGAIVDRRIRTISVAIINSTGHLKSLILQGAASAASASVDAGRSQASYILSKSSADAATIIWTSFTSLYAGYATSDPQKSSIGNNLSRGAFYVRASDTRLRFVTAVSSAGVPTWADATVAADPATVLSAIEGKFVSTLATAAQNVKSTVNFEAGITVKSVSDWGSQQAVPALDLTNKLNPINEKIESHRKRAADAELALDQYISGEIARAQASEASISGYIDDEIDRATDAEAFLLSHIDTEIARTAKIDKDRIDATNVEVGAIKVDLAATKVDLSGTKTDLENVKDDLDDTNVKLDTEVARAKKAEGDSKADLEAKILALVVPGTITLFFGQNAPVGWGICNGSSYPRVDGTGNIATPDLRGRVAVGVSGDHALGATFGNTLVSPETNSSQTGATVSTTGSAVDAGGGANRLQTVTLNDPGHKHTISNIDVTQPSLALHYIMKL